jgi:CBS domain-containing protein
VVEGEALVGLITRRDVVTKHAHIHLPVFIGLLGYVAPLELPGSREEVARALAVTASELMETDVVTIEPDAEVDDAATLMVDKDADPIPVVENGRLIGIITMADIIRLVLVEEGDGSNG